MEADIETLFEDLRVGIERGDDKASLLTAAGHLRQAAQSAALIRESASTEILHSRLLVVEGADERFVFNAFLGDLGLKDIQIVDARGKMKIRTRIQAFRNLRGFRDVSAIGVVRDADEDRDAAFRSVCDALGAAGLAAPKSPLEIVEGRPRVGVMIMPGGGAGGALEDLCLRSVESDPAMVCVGEFINCLQGKSPAPPKTPSKARVHAFLSSQEEPDLRLGEAIQKRYFPRQSSAFDEVREFLGKLFL